MDPFIHHRGHRGPNLFPLETLPNLKLLDDYLKINPRVIRARAIKEISASLRQEAKTSTIGVRLMNSVVHRYFMKDL